MLPCYIIFDELSLPKPRSYHGVKQQSTPTTLTTYVYYPIYMSTCLATSLQIFPVSTTTGFIGKPRSSVPLPGRYHHRLICVRYMCLSDPHDISQAAAKPPQSSLEIRQGVAGLTLPGSGEIRGLDQAPAYVWAGKRWG